MDFARNCSIKCRNLSQIQCKNIRRPLLWRGARERSNFCQAIRKDMLGHCGQLLQTFFRSSEATSGFGEGDGMQRHRSKTSVRPAPGRLDTAFLLDSEGNVRHCPVRLSLVGGLSAAALGKDSLGTNCFLFGSEGNVGHWLHLETGPIVRPSLR